VSARLKCHYTIVTLGKARDRRLICSRTISSSGNEVQRMIYSGGWTEEPISLIYIYTKTPESSCRGLIGILLLRMGGHTNHKREYGRWCYRLQRLITRLGVCDMWSSKSEKRIKYTHNTKEIYSGGWTENQPVLIYMYDRTQNYLVRVWSEYYYSEWAAILTIRGNMGTWLQSEPSI